MLDAFRLPILWNLIPRTMAGTFVIALSDSAAGCLKQAGIGDRVLGVTDELTEGPCPAETDILTFLRARRAAVLARVGPYEPESFTVVDTDTWLARIGEARYADTVDIWADPNPAAQLRLLLVLQILSHLHIETSQIAIVQANTDVGELTPDQAPRLAKLRQPLGERQRTLADTAWTALTATTPEKLANLLQQSLSPLPYLGPALRRLLEELPAPATGLSRTEQALLSAIAGGETSPYRVFKAVHESLPRLSGYWEFGRILDRLASAAAPLILGLGEGPFTSAMHDDAKRLAAWKASRLQPTKLGRAVLDGRDDYTRLRPIDRWVGGTHLVPGNVWRWDAAGSLVRP